jgi:hypothetical protein
LELAKVLTYREGTRPEGIRMLQALAQARPNDAAIRDAWRQALQGKGYPVWQYTPERLAALNHTETPP